MKLPDQIVRDLIDDELYEMANFHPDSTGLRFTVWFSGDPEGKHHRPRGKVKVQNEFYPFSLDEPFNWLAKTPPGISAKDTQRLAEFTRLNRDILLAYWNGTADTRALVERLQKLA